MSEPARAALPAQVLMGPDFAPSGAAELAEQLRLLGLDPSLDPAPELRGADVTWLVLASLPLAAFLGTLGTKLAEDGYAGLRDLVVRIARHGRRSGAGTHALLLEDEGTGTLVELDEALPDESYRRLFEVDLSANAGVMLRYEARTGRWTAVLEPGSAIGSGADRPDPASRRGVPARRRASGRRPVKDPPID
jgi:hypothetical protein